MLKIIPSKIECYDTDSDGKICDDVFTVEAEDEGCCTVKITTSIGNDNLEGILDKIRAAVKMLELD